MPGLYSKILLAIVIMQSLHQYETPTFPPEREASRSPCLELLTIEMQERLANWEA